MGLSKRHIDFNYEDSVFSVDLLAESLDKELPEAVFGLIFGSAKSGTVKAYSDLDLAFYLSEPVTYQFYRKVNKVVERFLPEVRADIGILNNAEPIFRYETLKGELLFTRDQEQYLRFYSLTCREYESQMVDYEKQYRYRMEVLGAKN